MRRIIIGIGLLSLIGGIVVGCDKQIKEAAKPAQAHDNRLST